MPRPLSVIAMRLTPPSSSRTVICVPPASSAFSSNSLTTAEGRSTTSPAAIWEISWSGRAQMGRGARGAFIAAHYNWRLAAGFVSTVGSDPDVDTGWAVGRKCVEEIEALYGRARVHVG